MNAKSLLPVLIAALFLGAGAVHSQAPAAESALQQIKKDNAALLQKQAASLKTLEELARQARQIKIFAKRG
jgi:hypothetical protein